MKYWLYAEPAGKTNEPVWTIMSDDAIIACYWDYWEARMIAHNKSQGLPEQQDVSRNNCIYDWVVVHWAQEATPEDLLRIIGAPKLQNSES